MPQMSPMNWIGLYVLFNLALGVSFCKLHYLYNDKELISTSEDLNFTKNSFTQIK